MITDDDTKNAMRSAVKLASLIDEFYGANAGDIQMQQAEIRGMELEIADIQAYIDGLKRQLPRAS